MKKVIVAVIVVVLIVVALWMRDLSERKAAAESVQANPLKTVESVMGNTAKLTGLMWDEKQREELKAEAERLEEAGEEATEEETRDVFEQYGLVPQYPLFADEHYGKSFVATLLMHRFDEFEVKSSTVKEATATISVEFTPKDVLGLKALTEKLGAPTPKEEPKPVSIVFYLEKKGYRWYITDTRGELSDAVRAFSRLKR
ncbi:MAG: hypothetical protein ACYTAN_07215 [Planctomycetota bacterium]|jgi:hypothetical protein